MILLDRRLWSHFDFISPCLIIPIIILSHMLISDSSDFLASKQLVYFGFGAVAFLAFFLLPLRRLEWLIPLFFWFCVVLLVGVEFFGVSKLGAKRWLEIPFVHFTIQPSEIMKPAFIMMIAYLIKKRPPDPDGYGIKSFVKFSFYIMVPFALILKEPDLGSALILLISGYGILFLVGVDKRIWITLAAIIAISAPVLYDYGLRDYQKKRIADFLGEPSYQVRQSVSQTHSRYKQGQKVTHPLLLLATHRLLALCSQTYSLHTQRYCASYNKALLLRKNAQVHSKLAHALLHRHLILHILLAQAKH